MESTTWQREVEQALAQNNHNQAKQLLAAVIRQNGQEREAWRILATIVTDPAQQAECLRRIAAIDAAPAAARIKPLASKLGAEPTPNVEQPILSINNKTTPLFAVQPTTQLPPINDSSDLPTIRLTQPTVATTKQPRSLPKTLMLLGASLCGVGLLILLGFQLWPLLTTDDQTEISEQPLQAEVELTIVRSGVGQTPLTDQAMVYFEIENPSDQALYNIPYTMTLTSQSNKLLKNTNTIELLLPKQKIVVTDGVFTGMSFRAKSVEISLGKGYPVTIEQPIPQIEAFTPTTFGMPFHGRLQDSWGNEYPTYHVSAIATDSGVVTSTLVSMLFYDANDQVIGAGAGYIDYINNKTSLPNTRRGETKVYPLIWEMTEVDRVEVTPAFSLATFNQKSPIKPKKVEIDQMWLGEYIPAVDPPYHVQDLVEYPSLPPTSGYHGQSPAEWGYYDGFVSDEAMVHNLEHGAVIVFYNPQLITSIELSQLEATFENLYRRDHHTILQKRFDLDATVAMTAWEYRLMLRDNANLAAINTFFSEHIARGPECVNLRCPN